MRAILRSLLAKPSYLFMSVVVLGVSIAAQMGIVAVVDATLIRPPSGRLPNELVFVRSSLPRGIVSFPDFVDIRERTAPFFDAFAYFSRSNVGITVGDDSILATCGVVSGGFFPTLGAQPLRGRLLAERDDSLSADPAAVVSAGLAENWKLSVGSIIRLNTVPFTVIGILPTGFRGVDPSVRPSIWISCSQIGSVSSMQGQRILANRDIQWLRVGGRLRPGASFTDAKAELTVIAQTLQKEHPTENHGMNLALDSFSKFRFIEDESARTMLLISGIIWFLFALAFVNFFSLTLLRIFTRRRELAIKLAMGARRADIGRWLAGEFVLVLALALVFGHALGQALLHALRLDPNIGRLIDTSGVEIDSRTVAVVALGAFGGATATWFLALQQACRVDLVSAIKETTSAPRRQIVVGILYAFQFAIAMFLLCVAASFIDSMRTVAARKLPFRTENLLLADVNLHALGITTDRAPVFVDKLLAAMRQTPGVIAVGASNHPLMTAGGWTNLIVNERDPALESDKCFCRRSDVTSGFWDAAGIPLLRGRTFTDADIATKSPVAVINAALARRFWPGQSALGKSFKAWPTSPLFSVIGVVADVPESRSATIDPLLYLPSESRPEDAMTLHIAVQRDSAGMRQEISRRLLAVWPYKNPPALRPIHDQIVLASADLVTAVRLVLWVAGFATLVTGCGLYFFSAYTASQSLKEAAIRMALGANQTDVMLAHLRKYRLAVFCGFALGTLLLIGVRPIFALFDISVTSPRLVYVLAAAVPLMAIAIMGLCVPLWRISRLNICHALNFSE
ncbi:MAG TPA: ABC transporter permease [Opitutaceae bacterium]|jgi:putative ABC transport system permease protein|nr:ABC transporter permease [Opitutaceae bacterium]